MSSKHGYSILNLGLQPGVSLRERQRVRITNLMGLAVIITNLIIILFAIFTQVWLLFFSNTAMVVIICLALWHNTRRQYTAAKTIMLSTTSFILLLLSKTSNTPGSIIELYFPLFAVYILFFDFKKERTAMLCNLLFSVTCFVLVAALPHLTTYYYIIEERFISIFHILNHILSLGLFCCFLYLAIYNNNQAEALLRSAAEAAEQAAVAKSRFLSNMSRTAHPAQRHHRHYQPAAAGTAAARTKPAF
jgi:hypothetical protein